MKREMLSSTPGTIWTCLIAFPLRRCRNQLFDTCRHVKKEDQSSYEIEFARMKSNFVCCFSRLPTIISEVQLIWVLSFSIATILSWFEILINSALISFGLSSKETRVSQVKALCFIIYSDDVLLRRAAEDDPRLIYFSVTRSFPPSKSTEMSNGLSSSS